MKEEWREIDDFPYYEVSNLGNVRSWRLGNGHSGMAKTPKMLNGSNVRGYRMVQLGRASKRLWVHRLVLETFDRRSVDNEECRHANGNRSDNRIENLSWASHAENMKDQYIHGTRIMGETHHQAILTDKQVKEIYEKVHAGKRGIGKLLAKKYGCTEATISHIKHLKIRKEAVCVSA